jgi:molybdate-binding protein/DNA-binding XRE family transcriptional regulator
MERGLSQKALAQQAGLTRQALYSIESNRYLPSTEITLRLARVLNCGVEDLFRLEPGNEIVEADLLGSIPESHYPVRANIARVGERLIVQPVVATRDLFNVMVPADGLILSPITPKRKGRPALKVPIELLHDRQMIEEAIVVAGCDPAMYLAGEHFRRYREGASVIGLTLGSVAAIQALKREEVHMAGLHLVDHRSGQSNMPYLKKHLNMDRFTVIRFARWEQGLIVGHANPKRILRIEDLARRGVHVVNREIGSGARELLDGQLKQANLNAKHIKGYDAEVSSHLEVARAIVEGNADAGIGVRSAARLFGLDFLPLREEHYDFVIPTTYLKSHPKLSRFLDTLVSRAFRKEMEALGGYDMKDIGKVVNS